VRDRLLGIAKVVIDARAEFGKMIAKGPANGWKMMCMPASTMLLGAIPQNRICVTSRATFEFTPPRIPGLAAIGGQLRGQPVPVVELASRRAQMD
jgi:hypothetical protein